MFEVHAVRFQFLVSSFWFPVSDSGLNLLIANLQLNLQNPHSGFWFPGSGFLVSASGLIVLAYLQIPDSGFWLPVSGFPFRLPVWT